MSSVNIQKFITHCSIWLVLWGSLLLALPENNVFSAEDILTIQISSPENQMLSQNSNVQFTGRITSSESPINQLNIQVFEQPTDADLQEITYGGQLSITDRGDYAEWTFTKEYSEGIHALTFIVNDNSGNSASVTNTFTIDLNIENPQEESVEPKENITTEPSGDETPGPTVDEPTSQQVGKNTAILELATSQEVIENEPVEEPRPTIVGMKIIPNGATDENDFLPAEDMTQVPLDAKIMLVVRDTVNINYTKPFIIHKSNQQPILSIEENGEPLILEKLEYPYQNFTDYFIPFTPTELLEPATTYYVYVNPMIKNDLGNSIFPRYFKFTTISKAHETMPHDIHGNVMGNSNSCAYCHSTHNGTGPSLIGGEYGEKAGNFCMACHDGTVAPPMPDKYDANNKHIQTADDTIKLNGCTSCHNPHIGWSKENPNKLKDYFEYTHQTDVVDSPTINSSEVLCENCHGPDDPIRDQVFSTNHYRTLSYSKSLAEPNKFDLCLNCHNGENGSDIEQYFTDSNSGHNFSALDGSLSNGQMPCAECHETHGSNNMYQLKENLGHVRRPDTDRFIMTEKQWTPTMEREFCLKCHNNAIEMFGKTATYSEKNTLDETIEGHEPTNEQACSTCHGNGEDFSERTKSAAHTPIKGAILKPPVTLTETLQPEETETPSN
jgi:predicted CXXCH cytochrome family protein